MQKSVGSQLAYLPHVDGLRMIAILLVVGYHAWPSLVPGGFIGVDVFFVISGFIITRQIAPQVEAGTFSFPTFLAHRARRLVPAAFVCIALVSVAASVILLPDALMDYAKSAAAAFGMVANVFFQVTSGYFSAPSAEKPLLHTWSLSVENQYYLTWPIMLLLLTRLTGVGRLRLAVVAALIALSLFHAQASITTNPEYAFYGLLPRACELLMGCWLALYSSKLTLRRALPVFDWAGISLVAGSAAVLTSKWPFPGLAAIPCCIGAALCIYAGLAGPSPISRLLSSRPAVFGGKISYSLYLYHWPLLALATYHLGRSPNPFEAGVIVVLSIVLACCSWMYVEQRLTRALVQRWRHPAQFLAASVASTLVVGLFTSAVLLGKGWPQRLDQAAADVFVAASKTNPLRSRCDGYENALSRDEECTFGRREPSASLNIAVFGDSNADHFVPLLGELATRVGLSGRQITQSACAPVIGIALSSRSAANDEACTRYHEAILEFLDQHPNLKIVVLAGVWTSFDQGLQLNRVGMRMGMMGGFKALTFEAAIGRTVAIIRSRGIKVLVIGQIPELYPFSLACFADAARTGTFEGRCAADRATLEQRYASTQDALIALGVNDPGVHFIDMLDLLCSRRFCTGFKGGAFVYRDGGHLNAQGSRDLAKYAELPRTFLETNEAPQSAEPLNSRH